jgi:hypothetical protein
MENQTLLLSNYINNSDNTNIDQLKQNLFKLGILTKDYHEDNMILLYNKYESRNKAPIELECRSVIINRETFEIVCYTCPTPIYNMDAVNYMLRYPSSTKEIFQCYEGSLLSLFNYNSKWYLSSRRCLDSENSIVNEVSHYKMFMDVLNEDGYATLNDFTKYLDIQYSYHFVLIHHSNRNIVNYEKLFGKNYKKLCFIFAREQSTQKEINSEDIEATIVSENIFLPKRLVDETPFDQVNQLCDMTDEPTDEGIVIKMNNMILKLQNISYQFYRSIGPEKNLYRGFISLYQANKLSNYFANNTNALKYKKIVNPTNLNESFDTIGTIDAVFKVCTSELYHLFNILWDKNGTHLNSELYNILSKEYRDILFHLRGIFFKNKKKYGSKTDDFFRIKDVYNYLKSIDSNDFESFMRSRKLMFNLLRVDNVNPNLKAFANSLYKSDKVFYKLSAIYSNKLFPEIMPDDLPPV